MTEGTGHANDSEDIFVAPLPVNEDTSLVRLRKGAGERLVFGSSFEPNYTAESCRIRSYR